MGVMIFGIKVQIMLIYIKLKVKLSRCTPWRRMGEEEV
jgi:hypothetical protein